MNESIKDLPYEVVMERKREAEGMGFRLSPEKPGYDLIGSKARAALIERRTEELVIFSAKIVERDGRPWIRTRYPRHRDYWEYVFLGWSV